MPRRIMIVAGEASGDLHGAGVVRELKRLDPTVEIFGVGGERMRAEGMDLVYHVNELSFMGFTEVLKHLPVIASVRRTLQQLLRLRKPDVVLLIDYPGFNLRFAGVAKEHGVKVLYYISPQVWAWHRSRVKKMRGVVDRMLVVFPFEVELYRKEGVEVEFVGHPLVGAISPALSRENFLKRYGFSSNGRILALLPGSRKQEIEHIFPVMLQAARRIAAEKDMEIGLAVAPTLQEQYFRAFYNLEGIRVVIGDTYGLMQYAEFALVTSGTATLETGYLGTPMVVLYRTSWLTYLIGRALVRIRTIALVNIVAGRKIVPEFIQHRARVPAVVRKVLAILGDPGQLAAMQADLAGLRSVLGDPGASRRVAERILQMA